MTHRDHEIDAHAKFQMERRQISEDVLDTVLRDPEQVIESISGRKVLHAGFPFLRREKQSNTW